MTVDYFIEKIGNDENRYPGHATRRPYFGPDQVQCRHELKRGLSYVRVCDNLNNAQEFVVTSDPYTNQNGHWCVNMHIKGTKTETVLYLADESLEPYVRPWPDCSIWWNAQNHVQFTDGSRHMKNCCKHSIRLRKIALK